MVTKQHALDALREIEQVLQLRVIMPEVADRPADAGEQSRERRALCNDYDRIRPKLDVALLQIDLLPEYGRQLAVTIRFLMQIADAHCLHRPA